MKGLDRCKGLQELSASDNQLTSLAGLRACAASLDILNACRWATRKMTYGVAAHNPRWVTQFHNDTMP